MRIRIKLLWIIKPYIFAIACCTPTGSTHSGGQTQTHLKTGALLVGNSAVILSDMDQYVDHPPIGNQVTPFGLTTPDGETIYAWHILPLPLYLQHEETVASQELGFCNDFTKTESFRLLKEDPEARLVLTCKANFIYMRSRHD